MTIDEFKERSIASVNRQSSITLVNRKSSILNAYSAAIAACAAASRATGTRKGEQLT
jgi:hypothetical protein